MEYLGHSPACPLRPPPQDHSICMFPHSTLAHPPADSSPGKKWGERRLKHRNRADVIPHFGYSRSLASNCMSLSRFWAAARNRKSIDDVAKDIIDDFHSRCTSLLPPSVRLRRVSSDGDHLAVFHHRLLTSPPMLNYIKKVHQGYSPICHSVPHALFPGLPRNTGHGST